MTIDRRKPLRISFLVIAGVSLVGLAATLTLYVLELDRTDIGRLNIYFVLYFLYEPPHSLLSLLLAAALLRGGFSSSPLLERSAALLFPRLSDRRGPLLAALGVAAATWAGAHAIYHRFPFSQDEFAVEFQAKIFAAGRLAATLPDEWRAFGEALRPVFITLRPETGEWFTSYLPVYSLLLAPFERLGLGGLLNPLLAGVSLVAVAALAARLWPSVRDGGALATLLLASSPQFLVYATSGYTMPAHLALNLVWLWLFTSESRLAKLAVPWVGFLAMGLHSYVPHALFAAPFLLRTLRERRFRLAAYYASVYLAASWIWISCLDLLNPVFRDLLRVGWPGRIQVLTQTMAVVLLLNWQSLALAVLAIIGALRWRRLSPVAKDLLSGVLVTWLVYFTFLTDQGQGHGWGSRYLHPVLGNVVLLAVPGWRCLVASLGRRRASGFVLFGVALSVLVQIPARAYEVERVIRPFARAQEHFAAKSEPIVVVHPDRVWYGQDLVRNDPFLAKGPKILFQNRLRDEELGALFALGPVHVVSQEELENLGLAPTRFRVVAADSPPRTSATPPPRGPVRRE